MIKHTRFSIFINFYILIYFETFHEPLVCLVNFRFVPIETTGATRFSSPESTPLVVYKVTPPRPELFTMRSPRSAPVVYTKASRNSRSEPIASSKNQIIKVSIKI